MKFHLLSDDCSPAAYGVSYADEEKPVTVGAGRSDHLNTAARSIMPFSMRILNLCGFAPLRGTHLLRHMTFLIDYGMYIKN